MTTEIDSAKLKHLLEHWIEHNESHGQSFREWAEKVRVAGYEDIAEDILQAERKMKECSDLLRAAEEKL